MNKLTLLLCSLFLTTFLTAQESGDASAKALLEKARKKYESYKSIEADFTLTIEPAEGKKEIQKGKMWQLGEKYRILLELQEIICDGKSSWLYLKRNNEVQINDAGTKGSANAFSPKAMLALYRSGNFIYYMGGSGTEAGKSVQFIEIKPVDRKMEYAKFRVAVQKSTNQIVSMKTFNKDGSRITLSINKLNTTKKIEAAKFVFDASKYKGAHIEDLRTN